jgi:hypothetical protein
MTGFSDSEAVGKPRKISLLRASIPVRIENRRPGEGLGGGALKYDFWMLTRE